MLIIFHGARNFPTFSDFYMENYEHGTVKFSILPSVYQSSSNGSSRRDSIQVPIYSSKAKRSTNSIKRQYNKYAPVPRTRRLSNNSPIVRRCSLQEDHSILMFQAGIDARGPVNAVRFNLTEVGYKN